MPNGDGSTDQSSVMGQPLLKVVEQSLDRADVQNTGASPRLRQHLRQDRDGSCLGLPSRGRGQQQAVCAGMNRCDGCKLRGSQGTPAQRVDDVVLQGWMQLLEFAHSSMSSTEFALAAARSDADISLSESVSE